MQKYEKKSAGQSLITIEVLIQLICSLQTMILGFNYSLIH